MCKHMLLYLKSTRNILSLGKHKVCRGTWYFFYPKKNRSSFLYVYFTYSDIVVVSCERTRFNKFIIDIIDFELFCIIIPQQDAAGGLSIMLPSRSSPACNFLPCFYVPEDFVWVEPALFVHPNIPYTIASFFYLVENKLGINLSKLKRLLRTAESKSE